MIKYYSTGAAALLVATLSGVYLLSGNQESEEHSSFMSGSWVYNALECQNSIDLASLYEIQIGDSLNKGAVNAFRTDKDTFEYNISQDSELNAMLDTAFSECDLHDIPDESPIISRFVNGDSDTLLALYQTGNIMIKIEDNKADILRPISRVKHILDNQKNQKVAQ